MSPNPNPGAQKPQASPDYESPYMGDDELDAQIFGPWPDEPAHSTAEELQDGDTGDRP